MNAQLTRSHIDKILSYLRTSHQFINCHMVEFITEKLWEKFIPVAIQDEVGGSGDIEAATKLFLASGQPSRFPSLHNFISNSEAYHLEKLEGVLLSQAELLSSIGVDANVQDDSVNIREFMNEKKNHEVEIVSKLVSTLTSNLSDLATDNMYVLDAGDGKGYLSSRLALQYNMKVLGIDASEVNTEGSQKRMKKLERAWTGLKERTEMINMGVTPPRRTKKPRERNSSEEVTKSASSRYKSINNYITKETDFGLLIRQHFDTEDDFKMCLTGLHTCGNLASTCLETFANNAHMKLLCNVGCCYHLLSEAYCTNDSNFTNTELISRSNSWGFPMSDYLKSQEVKLGRNARMLASQSIHRTQTKTDLNTQSLFYRALLEVIMKEKFPEVAETPRVGKVKKFSNFKEYLKRCDEKCQLQLDRLEASYVDEILEKYANMENLISLFYLVRMSYAQVIESLILLDRLLYLKEKGIEKSYLIRLFDPVTSPRCYGIVAIR